MRDGGSPVAEIKSTLELAMERTKDMTISEKEKEQIKKKELEQKVNSLSNRYVEGHLLLNEILKEIGRMDEKTRDTVKEMLLSQWINTLSLKDEDDRVLKGIETVKGEELGRMREKFRHLLSQYQLEKEKVQQKARARSLEALKKDGIHGSALEPNIEGSDLWKTENEKLDRSYQTKLYEIKEQLRNL
jgi:hypothetical protein